jgi:RNA recognition motif-containing protein
MNPLNSVFEATIDGETKQSKFNKHSTEFKPLLTQGHIGIHTSRSDDEYFSTMGSALDELLAEVNGKYANPPSESPMPCTAQTTPQMSATILPPPPGYDPIVEGFGGSEDGAYYDPSMYSSPTYSWRSYPPPFHLGHKLFVGALPYSVTEADLFPLFGQFGEILELHIQRDWLGRSKGCAWLRYSTTDECDAAIDALHNNYYLGSMNRPLQLTYASDKQPGMRPRTSSMNEEISAIQPAAQIQNRSRAMTDCSIPTPSSSVLGKLRQMMSSSETASKAEVELEAGPSPVKEETNTTAFQASGFSEKFPDSEINRLFKQFGPLVNVERISTTCAVVEFRFSSDAERAKSVINGVTLAQCDTPITVLPVV